MPGSKDFQNLQVSPRQIAFLAGLLIYDAAEHPASSTNKDQRKNLDRYKTFGNNIYRDLGFEGLMKASDAEVSVILEQSSKVLHSLKVQYGDGATSKQKQALDAARGACLTRISWLQAGIQKIRVDERSSKEFIVMNDGSEQEFDVNEHSYLSAMQAVIAFNVGGSDNVLTREAKPSQATISMIPAFKF